MEAVRGRTDLALESRQAIFDETGREPRGVETQHESIGGFAVDRVTVSTRAAARELGKPVGRYITVSLDELISRREGAFQDGAACIARLLREFGAFPADGPALVVGLGNRAMTPDALGPLAVEHVLVTRHLVEQEKEVFGNFRSVAAVAAGVLGTTGMEAGELARAVRTLVRPAVILTVDALASCSLRRLCRTVQLTDAGVVPGSGVGNRRAALNARTMGVPVISLGVPTVMDTVTVAREVFPDAGDGRDGADAGQFFVTPRDIDARVADCAKLIGYGINLALQDGLSVQDLDMLLS